MFTGIVQDVGRVVSRETRGGDIRLLTAVELRDRSFAADVSRESLSLTTLGELTAGSRVNLEPSLKAGDALGGHLVSGHVDGIGEIAALSGDARSTRIEISV